MRVVLAMTGHTVRRQCRLGDILRDVAGLAIKTPMGPGQRVVRLGVVIKPPALPAVRVMTICAIRSQATFVMHVAMTGIAIQRGTLELQ